MDKKRMTAGSVEELLEIVRAVQNGEDPDINKIREKQRKKREEEILERRRKKSQGSADSAEPARASAKRKTEKNREEEQPKADRREAEKPKEKARPDGGDAQEPESGAQASEDAADFSWPQFDPRKMLAARNAGADEEEKPETDGGAKDSTEKTDESEKPEEAEEETEEGRPGIFDFLWGRRDEEPEDEEEDLDEEESSELSERDSHGPNGEELSDRGSQEEEDDFDDDEFERLLNEDNTEEEFIKSKETVTAFTAKAAGLLGGLWEKAGRSAAGNREKAGRAAAGSREKTGRRKRDSDEFSDDFQEEFPSGKPERRSTKERTVKGRTTRERKADGELETDRNHIRSLERSLSRIHREDEDFEDDFTDRESRPEPDDRKPEREPVEPDGRKTERERSESDGWKTEKELSEPDGRKTGRKLSEPDEWKAEREPSEPDSRELDREPSEADDRKAGSGGRRRESAKGPKKKREPQKKKSSGSRKKPAVRRKRQRAGISLPDGIPDLLHAVKSRIRGALEALGQRGIYKREIVMLAIVLLFVLLILFFLVNAVRGFFGQRQKSRNVTADDGLTVTVEDEPQEWVSSYPVKLKLSCRKGNISSVTINGVSCTPDENGIVTVETGDWSLQAQVGTDDGTKTAKIEIPMLDDEAPDLDVKREGDTIVLSAADTRSQVEGIYYSVMNPNGYQQLPEYSRYKEPIKYEEGMIYRFFAKDKAGNSTTPSATTLEDAESFALGKTRFSLFPGETCSLSVEAEPAGALLRNLKFESLDTSVATVEENGKITAAGEGTTEIRVSADQMESQTCTVEVSEERTVLVSTIGDCTLGSDEAFNTTTSFDAFDAVNGHDYFFRNVKDILGNDDVTFANFEGTLTSSTAREAKQFAFKGDPSYTEILKDGSVEVVTLANNHSRDYGEQSLEDTKTALKEADIDYCIGDEIVMREVNGVQTAFIGIYVLDIGLEVQSQMVQAILQARQLGADIVIVAFHWGSEKATTPDETQRSLAHTAIDRGADLVVGHHPHVLQGIEQYNGKYIVYSLANFCFGGNSAPSDMDTIIFQQSFTVGQDGTVKDGGISVIPCSISSESGYNNYQPTPASGDEAQRIIGRLNEYSEEFGQTYTAAGA